MLPRRAPHGSCSSNLRWPREMGLTGRRRPRSWSQEPWAPRRPRRSSRCSPWLTSQQIGAAPLGQVVRELQYAEVSERLAQAQHTEDSIALLARRVTRIENALRSLAARLDHDALVEYLREPSEDGGSTTSMHGSSARSASDSGSLQAA